MRHTDWRSLAGATFTCEKQPASASRGMIVTNHPLASAAGAEMLTAGGNAIDAATAALFTLTVVEPMMVGVLGGGIAHIRLANGTHHVLDGQSTAPLATGPTTYTPDPEAAPGTMDAVGRRNAVGPTAVAVPGNLMGWCEALRRFGTFSLADVTEPAIRHASRGFRVTPYLQESVSFSAADLARDAEIAKLYLPAGLPIEAGTRLVTGDYAESLRSIAREGPDILYGGELGRCLAEHMAEEEGFLTLDDLTGYRTVDRAPLRGLYRGYEIVGPPPPSSGPLHIIQMLNILEGYDIGALGFATPDTLHLLTEVLKIAFADRAAATADPAFVQVPVSKLLSKDYAAERRARIRMDRTQSWSARVAPGEGAHTTHLTVADGLGNVVASTQTINNLFGACYIVPGTGMIPNNYMRVFDPHPGRANSVAPGKRVTSSMSPVMVLRDGRLRYALGLPGGLRIFPTVMQVLSNLIDHGMSVQEAVEAPRLWTQGYGVEVEASLPESVLAVLRDRGHDVAAVNSVGCGMSAIQFDADGTMTGAACWRADGTPIGLGGGLARPGVV
ncbi:gamma-glutamyltransferase [Mesorhizobium sp.]|uniref:gamma-glutamyltransferase n=1 Tax=Mesorhizobium sp. TaxID=1871066 RepID=UPI00120866BE|nr:gamma-glutamyltransferase [Mesorhizobium sp.]TIO24084.1 MAG: gamma-glutamyltransferase [Mesorhizobium sp.]